MTEGTPKKSVFAMNDPNKPGADEGYGQGQVAPESYEPHDLDARMQQPPLNPTSDLMALRSQFPFLPVMPFPTVVKTVVLAANVAQDLVLADGTTVAMFFGSADFFLSREGNAVIPSSVNVAKAFSIFKPDRFLWYTRGMQNVSVISATAGCTVQALCYITQGWPSRQHFEERR
jgi:hypothetical protein